MSDIGTQEPLETEEPFLPSEKLFKQRKYRWIIEKHVR